MHFCLIIHYYFIYLFLPDCKAVPLAGPQGTIQTPNYPGNYSNDLRCSWIISSRPTSVVHFVFTDFDVEQTRTIGCNDDYLEVSDIETQLLPLIVKTIQMVSLAFDACVPLVTKNKNDRM